MAISEGILLEDLAARLSGRLEPGGARAAGGILITGVGALSASGPGDIAYASNLANYTLLLASPCAAIIVAEDFAAGEKPLLIVPDAKAAYIACLELFAPRYAFAPGVSAEASVRTSAVVAPSAVIMERVTIMDGAVIGERAQLWPGVYVGMGARIGADTVLHPNVVVRERCVVGDRVVLHAGAVIGADGFGYTALPDGSKRKVPQIGNVIIEDDVEIGANSAVDRATSGSTVIGRGSKIDNLVQIAHNVILGSDTVLAAQVGIAGSTTIGAGCLFGGQAGVADHCVIGERAIIGPQAGVQKRRIAAGEVYQGTPAIPMKKFKRILPYFHRLPELFDRQAEREKEK